MLSFTASAICGYIIAEGRVSRLHLPIDIRAPLQILVRGGLIPQQWLTRANWVRVAAEKVQSYIKSSCSEGGRSRLLTQHRLSSSHYHCTNDPENECLSHSPNKNIFEVVAHGSLWSVTHFVVRGCKMFGLQLARLHKQLMHRKDSRDLLSIFLQDGWWLRTDPMCLRQLSLPSPGCALHTGACRAGLALA